MKKVWKSLLILAAALIFCALPGGNAQAKVTVKVKSVTVKSNYGKMVHVAVGKKVKLTSTVKVTPNKDANKKVTYTSSNKKIATVTEAGNVKGVKTGSCNITVKSKKNSKKKATIKVKVVKKVTKVKVTAEKSSIYVGESLALKTTVTPAKGSFKSLKWSTSNSKIATVSNKGVVKGIAGGSVTIKATSVEGSSTSGSRKIKILTTDSINIKSVQVLTGSAVRVTLDKVKTLTPADVVLEGKQYSSGKYTRKYTIDKMRNYDNKTYDFILKDDYSIGEKSFLKASIASLPGNGTKSMEVQAFYVKNGSPASRQWVGLVGDKWRKTVDLSEYCYGDITYTVTGSVPGLNYKASNNALIFSGKLTTVTATTELKIEAVDELNNKVTQIIKVHVGDDNTVVASAEDMTLLNGEKVEKIEFSYALGGSGKYTFSAANMPTGMMMEKDGAISGTPSGVGEYTVQVTAVDTANQSMVAVATAVIKVVDKRKITGTVKDVAGNPVGKAEVVCQDVNNGNIYRAVTDDAGMYTVYVSEGTYDVSAEFAGVKDFAFSIAVGTGGRRLDFDYAEYLVTIPLTTAISGADKYVMMDFWKDEEGFVYKGINVLLLKPGNYNLEGLVEVYQGKKMIGKIKGMTLVIMDGGMIATPIFVNYTEN